MLSWYALHVRSNCERLVSDTLAYRELEPFWPSYQVKRGKETVEKSLFPGYVFAHLDLGSQKLAAVRIPQVVRFVGIGADPLPIPDGEIEGVRQLVLQAPAAVTPCEFVEAGDRVLVESGPLIGLEGFVVYQKNAVRVVVSCQMLARSISAEVDIACLRRLPPPRSPKGASSHFAPQCHTSMENRLSC